MAEIQKVFWSRIGHSVNERDEHFFFSALLLLTSTTSPTSYLIPGGWAHVVNMRAFLSDCIAAIASHTHARCNRNVMTWILTLLQRELWVRGGQLLSHTNVAAREAEFGNHSMCFFSLWASKKKKKALVQLSGHFRSNAFICITVWCIVTDYAVACKDGRKR